MAGKNQQRQLDIYLDYYNKKYPTQSDKIVQGCCAFGISLAILGLSWALPFPHLRFLGQYNSYFNWASFVIAISIYYYSTLSPLLSYVMLFLALIFSYLISLLGMHYSNSNFLVQLYFLILFVCGIIRCMIFKITGKSSTLKMEFLFILIGPGWIFHFILKRLSIKY